MYIHIYVNTDALQGDRQWGLGYCSAIDWGGLMCMLWLIHMCVVTHSYMCSDPLLCVPGLIFMCAMTLSYVCHDSFMCASWRIHMCSFICVPWRIHTCAMTQSYVCHDSFICVPWRIHMCALKHSCVCHDVCHDVLIPVSWVIAHVRMSLAHVRTSLDTALYQHAKLECDVLVLA